MPLFFVTIDVERAVGLEDILKNYHIISLDHSDKVDYLREKGVKVFCVANIDPKFKPKIKSTNQTLSHPAVLSYIQKVSAEYSSTEKAKVLVFKTNEGIEKIVSENNLELIEVHSDLNKLFEDKISQYHTLASTLDHKFFPKIITTNKFSDISWEDAKSKCLSEKLVIQFPRGNSGKTTYFINGKQEYENLKSLYPLRITKIAGNVEGQAYTINACITKYGTISGGLNEQLTGIEVLTSSIGGTCGNDWSQIGLSEDKRKAIVNLTGQIGRVMKDHGFLGMFGVDFIINHEDIYLIEINSRQTASVPMHSKLQLKDKELPLQLAHILELTNSWEDYSKFEFSEEISEIIEDFKKSDLNELSLRYNQPKSASQLLLRNINKFSVTIRGQFSTGIYKYGGDNTGRIKEDNQDVLKVLNIDEDGDKSLCLLRKSYDISSIEDMEGFVMSSMDWGEVISPSMEYGRIQFPFSVLDDQHQLRGWVFEAINTLKRHTLK